MSSYIRQHPDKIMEWWAKSIERSGLPTYRSRHQDLIPVPKKWIDGLTARYCAIIGMRSRVISGVMEIICLDREWHKEQREYSDSDIPIADCPACGGWHDET